MIFDNVLEMAKSVSHFTIAGEGNVSVRDGDAMLIKASGSTLETMTDEDLVRCDLDGNALDGEEKKPSMEVSFHAWILKTFPSINCVCHTHPTNTIKILCSSRLPLREAIKTSVEEFIGRNGFFPKLILLKNHGIITTGASVRECTVSTLMCEKSAEIFIGAKLLNNIQFLTPQEVAAVDINPSEKYRRELYK